MKKIAKAHAIFSVFLFVLYLGLSMIYSPEFLFSDIKNKFSAFANDTITITAKVLSPPVKPVVSGSALCQNGILSVDLDWSDDENTENFEVWKDGSLLASGLTNSDYQDLFVNVSSSYEYVVIANGDMGPGIATSESVTITTPLICEIVLPSPFVNILSFDSKNVSSFNGNIQTENLRPIFSGNSNIANAIVSLSIHSSTIIFTEVIANINGYWSWTPSVDISKGDHTLFITATDPLDSNRVASDSVSFTIIDKIEDEIEDEDENENENKKDKKTKKSSEEITTVSPPSKTPPPIATVEMPEKPFDFSLFLENDSVFQGKEIRFSILIENLLSNILGQDFQITYEILDEDGKRILKFSKSNRLKEKNLLYENILIPKYTEEGNYKLKVEIETNGYLVGREVFFEIKNVPILKVGGGFVMTYPEILSRLGSTSILITLLLLVWILLFSEEYWLYLNHFTNITEKNFEKMGFFGNKKRKGVNK